MLYIPFMATWIGSFNSDAETARSHLPVGDRDLGFPQ